MAYSMEHCIFLYLGIVHCFYISILIVYLHNCHRHMQGGFRCQTALLLSRKVIRDMHYMYWVDP